MYFTTNLSKQGEKIYDFIKELIGAFPEIKPVKFSAPRVDIRRNRYYRINKKNLAFLKEELKNGLIEEFSMNDNLGSENFTHEAWYTENRYSFRFHLDIAEERWWKGYTHRYKISRPLRAELMVNYNFLSQKSLAKFWHFVRRMLVWVKPMCADVFSASNANVCSSHAMGVIDIPSNYNDKNLIVRDMVTLWDEVDVLVRDAYPGLFLNKNHTELLGGVGTIRKNIPYEIIEEVGNGVFMLVCGDPSKWATSEVKEKIHTCKKFISSICMASLTKEKYDKHGVDYGTIVVQDKVSIEIIESKVNELRKRVGIYLK